jgi:hypothetical protein
MESVHFAGVAETIRHSALTSSPPNAVAIMMTVLGHNWLLLLLMMMVMMTMTTRR